MKYIGRINTSLKICYKKKFFKSVLNDMCGRWADTLSNLVIESHMICGGLMSASVFGN